MKKLLYILGLVFMFMTTSAFAADYYALHEFNYESTTASSVYVTGAECLNNDCSQIGTENSIRLYNSAQFLACYNAPTSNAVFNSCIAGAEITNNIAPGTGVVTRVTTPSTFGHITYFSAVGDEYLVKDSRSSNYVCNFSICLDSETFQVNFEKKANAIAEIGQLNVVNIDNPLLPVQVTVPVSIEETVCSAFRFTSPDAYRPTIPSGYSDYQANTLVSLEITQDSTSTQLLSQSITIPIEADTCAGLAAFSWTPNSGLEGEDVTFRVETDVIDNQVSSSIIDWAEVTENMYPTDLDGACWTRAHDFTLSNVASTNLNTSVAQISEGESLYAIFRGGAYRDNNLTPMNYEARVLFNGTIIYQQLLTSTASLDTHTFDLSANIAGLSAGSYNVSLITTPVGLACTTSESVTQTQNLQLLVPDVFDVNFFVRDPDGNNVVNADINLELISADDYFQTAPTFNQNLFTNSFGFAGFTGAYRGDYTYTVDATGYPQVTNDIHIGSNTDIYITLVDTNTAPLIDLPTSLTEYYLNPITLDIRNYVSDFNDAFDDLTITSTLLSGNAVINFDGETFTFTTNAPNTAVVRIFVQDPLGDTSFDDITLNFIDNQAPVVNTFVATPDNGNSPFNTIFTIDVNDADGDSLICSLDFGDGTSTNGVCSSLDGIAHTYVNEGTFNAELTVIDGFNTPVVVVEQVFVFNFTTPVPIVNSFTLSSTNGAIVPTDLTLDWNVTHEAGYPTTCTLRVNGVNNSVPCIGSFNILNYNITGTGVFTIIAIDNASNQVIRQITQDFYLNSSHLANIDIDLITEETITPGEFNFFLEIDNETVNRRVVDIIPTISCDGEINRLSNDDGELDTSAISQREGTTDLFELRLDTQDFRLNIPKGEDCTFSVMLIDDLGSSTTISETVVFAYEEEEEHTTSIRGKGVDVISYMESVISNDFVAGYNVINFVVENNELESKELTMTLISAPLSIEVLEQEHIAPGAENRIQIPIFIAEDTKPGLYPIRISVNDESDKQTRYTYLKVN